MIFVIFLHDKTVGKHFFHTSPVRYIDIEYRLSIYRHFWKILILIFFRIAISMSISIFSKMTISISISISIFSTSPYRYRYFSKVSIYRQSIFHIDILTRRRSNKNVFYRCTRGRSNKMCFTGAKNAFFITFSWNVILYSSLQ